MEILKEKGSREEGRERERVDGEKTQGAKERRYSTSPFTSSLLLYNSCGGSQGVRLLGGGVGHITQERGN